jgi:hypothetical protein
MCCTRKRAAGRPAQWAETERQPLTWRAAQSAERRLLSWQCSKRSESCADGSALAQQARLREWAAVARGGARRRAYPATLLEPLEEVEPGFLEVGVQRDGSPVVPQAFIDVAHGCASEAEHAECLLGHGPLRRSGHVALQHLARLDKVAFLLVHGPQVVQHLQPCCLALKHAPAVALGVNPLPHPQLLSAQHTLQTRQNAIYSFCV